MWILFSFLCMVSLVSADIIGKKAVMVDELAPIKLRIIVIATSFLLGIVMYILKMGESGLAPWILLIQHPLLLMTAICMICSEYLYLCSYKFTYLSVVETISSLEGICIFVGAIIVNQITGSLDAIKNMLSPGRLIPICIVLIFTILLPNTETITNRINHKGINRDISNHRMIVGIILALIGVIFGATDSLLGDTILDTGIVNGNDMIMTILFSEILILPSFLILLNRKETHINVKHKMFNRFSIPYTSLYILNIVFGITSLAIDAVRTEVMFLIYPVIGIVGAKVFLKEKCTRKQNFCIWIITLSAIAFCVIDYID